jgi:hypothetical protein
LRGKCQLVERSETADDGGSLLLQIKLPSPSLDRFAIDALPLPQAGEGLEHLEQTGNIAA